jgi:hypothetical protein
MPSHRHLDAITKEYFSTVTPEQFEKDLAEFSPPVPIEATAEPPLQPSAARTEPGGGQAQNLELRLATVERNVRDLFEALRANTSVAAQTRQSRREISRQQGISKAAARKGRATMRPRRGAFGRYDVSKSISGGQTVRVPSPQNKWAFTIESSEETVNHMMSSVAVN